MSVIRHASAKRGDGAGPRERARILLVDDHPIVRHGLAQVLARESDMTLCATVEKAADAVDAVRRERPDLAVVDISLGDGNGIDLLKDLHAARPSMKLMVLSMHDGRLYERRALRAGAQGYVMKHEPAPVLALAIRKVLSGGIWVSEGTSREILHEVISGGRQKRPAETDDLVAALTDREMTVFEMIGKGLCTKRIAERLHRSVKTIETHRIHIKRKLRVADTAELMRLAMHWVEKPPPAI